MIPRTIAATVTVLAGLLAACGSDTGPAGSGGATSTTTGVGARTPMLHREAETACTAARPPGFGGFDDPMDKCTADADCTMGTNGRCVAAIGQPTFCSYDECASDADCGSVTACECRLAPNYNANTCVHGTCRVDADCGAGGYCSPSGVSLFSNCLTDIEMGSIGYFCHKPDDECLDDADCSTMMNKACLFSVAAMRWRCHDIVCTK